VFDYDYGEIARILGTKQDNARQLASRARRHVGDRRPRFTTSDEERQELAHRFFAAAQEGDLAGLEALLAPDVTLTGDGGGKAPALARALSGRNRVARTLRNWSRFGKKLGVTFDETEVNGAPGAIVRDGEGGIISVMSLEIEGGQIRAITGVVNPDKLAHLA
jgi:ketosteroid isomerase-like protein